MDAWSEGAEGQAGQMDEEEYQDETDRLAQGYVNYPQLHSSKSPTTEEPVQAALPYADLANYPATQRKHAWSKEQASHMDERGYAAETERRTKGQYDA